MLVFRVGSVQVSKINVSITAVPVMDVSCFTRTFRLMRLSPRLSDLQVLEQLHKRHWLKLSRSEVNSQLFRNNIFKWMLMPIAQDKMFKKKKKKSALIRLNLS